MHDSTVLPRWRRGLWNGFTRPENIQEIADQQSSPSPLKTGAPSSVKEIEPLISCYQEGRTRDGTRISRTSNMEPDGGGFLKFFGGAA